MKRCKQACIRLEGREVEGSEVDVLPHPLSSKRMQTCLQRFICSEEGAETAILKLFEHEIEAL